MPVLWKIFEASAAYVPVRVVFIACRLEPGGRKGGSSRYIMALRIKARQPQIPICIYISLHPKQMIPLIEIRKIESDRIATSITAIKKSPNRARTWRSRFLGFHSTYCSPKVVPYLIVLLWV